jgi:hypothetical protein
VNTHSLLSAVNRLTAMDAGTVSMHLAVQNQITRPLLPFRGLWLSNTRRRRLEI